MNIFRIAKLTAAALAGFMLGLGTTGYTKAEEPAPQPNTGAPASEADRIAIPVSGPAAASMLNDLDPAAYEKAEKERTKPVRELVEMLWKYEISGSQDKQAQEMRKEVAQAIRERGTNALLELVRMIGSPKDDSLQLAVPKAFKILGADAKPAIPMLMAHFKNLQTARTATYCLEAIGQAAVPPLVEALADTNKKIRAEAIIALRSIGEPEVIAPLFIKRMKDEDDRVRWLAYDALAGIGARGQQLDLIVPELLKALHDPEYYQKYAPGVFSIQAAVALARLADAGQQSDRILPVLLALVQDKAQGPAIRSGIIEAWGQQPGQYKPVIQAPVVIKEVLPALWKTIEDPDAKVRDSSVRLLVQLEKDQDKVLPMLLKALKDQDPLVRMTAAAELVRRGDKTHAEAVRTVCLNLIEHPGEGEDRQYILLGASMIVKSLDQHSYESTKAKVPVAATCIDNLKQLREAAKYWALEYKKQNGAEVKMSDLVPNYILVEPRCPAGNKPYILKPFGTNPECPNCDANDSNLRLHKL